MNKLRVASIWLIVIAGFSYADISSRLNITEIDGSPSTYPYKAKFTNGSVTDNGDGTVSIAVGGGGGTPGGSDTQVQFNNAGSFGGDVGYTWDNTKKSLLVDNQFTAYPSSIGYLNVGMGNFNESNFNLYADNLGSGRNLVGFYTSNFSGGYDPFSFFGPTSGESSSQGGGSEFVFFNSSKRRLTTFSIFGPRVSVGPRDGWAGGGFIVPALSIMGDVSAGSGYSGVVIGQVFASSNAVVSNDATYIPPDSLIVEGGVAVGTMTVVGRSINAFYGIKTSTMLATNTVQFTTNAITGVTTTYANGVIKGASISADQLTGTLAAGQFPALTGAVTNSAGSLATTEAKTLSNVNTFAASSITVAGASGLSVPNGVIASTAIYASSAPISTDEYDNGNSSTAQTIDWTHGNMQKSTLTGNVTFTFRAPPHQATLTLRLLTGSGGFTAAWPGTVKWSGGTAPTITTTASKSDFVICKYASDGSYYCSASGTQNF